MSRLEFFPKADLFLFKRDTPESYQSREEKLNRWLALSAGELRSHFDSIEGLQELLVSKLCSLEVSVQYTVKMLLVLNKVMDGEENPFGESLMVFLSSEDVAVFRQGCELLRALIVALPRDFMEKEVVPLLMDKLNQCTLYRNSLAIEKLKHSQIKDSLMLDEHKKRLDTENFAAEKNRCILKELNDVFSIEMFIQRLTPAQRQSATNQWSDFLFSDDFVADVRCVLPAFLKGFSEEGLRAMLDLVEEKLRSTVDHVRSGACDALGMMGGELNGDLLGSAKQALFTVLETDDNAEVRYFAADALVSLSSQGEWLKLELNKLAQCLIGMLSTFNAVKDTCSTLGRLVVRNQLPGELFDWIMCSLHKLMDHVNDAICGAGCGVVCELIQQSQLSGELLTATMKKLMNKLFNTGGETYEIIISSFNGWTDLSVVPFDQVVEQLGNEVSCVKAGQVLCLLFLKTLSLDQRKRAVRALTELSDSSYDKLRENAMATLHLLPDLPWDTSEGSVANLLALQSMSRDGEVAQQASAVIELSTTSNTIHELMGVKDPRAFTNACAKLIEMACSERLSPELFDRIIAHVMGLLDSNKDLVVRVNALVVCTNLLCTMEAQQSKERLTSLVQCVSELVGLDSDLLMQRLFLLLVTQKNMEVVMIPDNFLHSRALLEKMVQIHGAVKAQEALHGLEPDDTTCASGAQLGL